MGSLADAVNDEAVEVVVTRYEPAPRQKGRSAAPIATQFTAAISVQALNQRERRALPEGTRAEGRVKGYTTTELRVGTEDGARADRFHYNGVDYVLEKVDDWSDAGGYYRIEATAVR
jgi:hypothetical protein